MLGMTPFDCIRFRFLCIDGQIFKAINAVSSMLITLPGIVSGTTMVNATEYPWMLPQEHHRDNRAGQY